MNLVDRKKLVEQLVTDENFNAQPSNITRVDYVLSKVQSYDQFCEKIATAVKKVREDTRKNQQTAHCFIGEAQLHLIWGNLESALTSIHNALLYAPTKSVCDKTRKTKLYIDKASIHFEQKNYSAVLWSIEMAKHCILDCNKNSSEKQSKLVEYRLLDTVDRSTLGDIMKEAIETIDHIIAQHSSQQKQQLNIITEHLLVIKQFLHIKEELYNQYLMLFGEGNSDNSKLVIC